MADYTFRGFLQGAFISAGKDWPTTISLLEAVMTSQYGVVKAGQGSVVSTSINGKTFSFQISGKMTPDQVIGMAQRAWALVTRCMTSDAGVNTNAGITVGQPGYIVPGTSALQYLTNVPCPSTQANFAGMISQ